MQQMAEKTKVTLKGVAETLLISLMGRAHDAATQNPILGDLYAKEVMEKLDYNFDELPMSRDAAAGIALRTRIYDRWTEAFLAAHSHVTVLHLACGLDSRCQRVDWGSHVHWIDVDLPEAVALRRQMLPTSLPGKDYQLIDADVTESTWQEAIPTDRPTLVVMEGLLSYLQPEDGKRLLQRLVGGFGEGELLFDCLNTVGLSASQKTHTVVSQTGNAFKWAIDDLKDIEDIHPKLKLLEVIRYLEAPGLEELPFMLRFKYYIMSWIPGLADAGRFVRFAFSDGARKVSR
jgi:O-methyltransferase involved in polyketide biosynthesis